MAQIDCYWLSWPVYQHKCEASRGRGWDPSPPSPTFHQNFIVTGPQTASIRKKKVSKENLTGDSIQNDGNHCWGVTAFLRNGRSAPPSFLTAWPPAGTCFQFSRCPDSYYVSLAMTARTTRESCPLWIRSGLPLAACEVGAGTHDDHVSLMSALFNDPHVST